MTEPCDTAGLADSSSKPYTWLVYDDESVNDACVGFALPGIVLRQEPSESLDFEYTSRYYCDVDDEHHLNKYSLRLVFRNNLHELARDYDYEVIGSALLPPRDATDDEAAVTDRPYHQLLFAHRRRRLAGSIEIKEIFSVRRSRLLHLCFGIRRFKDRGDQDTEELAEPHAAMLLRTGLYSDVKLKVNGRIFPVHKHLLSSRSPVFRAMFGHGEVFPENRENGCIVIDDLDPEVIEQLLVHVYTGEAPKLASMSRQLFEAAHRYELAELRRACEEFFVFGLSRDNVIEILDMAGLYELKELRQRALEFVRNHEAEMAAEQSFRCFLCRDLRVDGVADTLRMCAKYGMEEVKAEAMEFVKEHSRELVESEGFLELFRTHPDLMREIFVYVHR